MQSTYPIELLESNASLPSQDEVLARFRRRVIDREAAAPAESPAAEEEMALDEMEAEAPAGVTGDENPDSDEAFDADSTDEASPESATDEFADDALADDELAAESTERWDEDTNVDVAVDDGSTDDAQVEDLAADDELEAVEEDKP